MSFVQFKKREKHPSRIIIFSKAWECNNMGIPSLFLSFFFLITPTDSTNDQNIVTIERSEL